MQNTAYEMRISDWSSYVCSSDLANNAPSHSQGEGKATTQIVTLSLEPSVQGRATERQPWMLGSSPSMTIEWRRGPCDACATVSWPLPPPPSLRPTPSPHAPGPSAIPSVPAPRAAPAVPPQIG